LRQESSKELMQRLSEDPQLISLEIVCTNELLQKLFGEIKFSLHKVELKEESKTSIVLCNQQEQLNNIFPWKESEYHGDIAVFALTSNVNLQAQTTWEKIKLTERVLKHFKIVDGALECISPSIFLFSSSVTFMKTHGATHRVCIKRNNGKPEYFAGTIAISYNSSQDYTNSSSILLNHVANFAIGDKIFIEVKVESNSSEVFTPRNAQIGESNSIVAMLSLVSLCFHKNL